MKPVVPVKAPPRWDDIDLVLLDMDGTLLDKHFDDHFWEEYVPEQYALAHGMSREEAKGKLMKRYRAQEGTLNWTNLDYWSGELGLDIPALKEQVDHLIAVHPFVPDFLMGVRGAGKKVCLVTNAHGKTLDLKMRKTSLGGMFHAVYTSQELGAPKEDRRFWEALRRRMGFDPARTFLAEDTLSVLEAAWRFKIRYLVHILKSSSARPPGKSGRFYSIETFKEIIP
ncbi:MAG: HAD hydrolase-like protein [Deltaproteobacteria bacterium]|nr:HAD hydrolase-like protein [Deltaproteobacteria bacterium]